MPRNPTNTNDEHTSPRRIPRRTALTALGTLAATGLAGCLNMTNDNTDNTDPSNTGPSNNGTNSDPTDGPFPHPGNDTDGDGGEEEEEEGDTPGIPPGTVTRIDADPSAGFQYPYFLATPRTATNEGDPAPVTVEPNNTGKPSDDLSVHADAAKSLIENGPVRRIADELNTPALVPIFPRPQSEPVNWQHYVHALDDTTMEIEDGPLERVDLQLINMVDHAAIRLVENGYNVSGDMLLNGFSASGNFVDRFTVLHPGRVLSVTAGGLNGMPILPLSHADGHDLPFHVGINNVNELTGRPVDLNALDEVNQYLFMGANDENDTIPYDDAWTDDHLKQTALDVYGDDMVEDRFPRSQDAYDEAGVTAQFRVYNDAGHSPHEAMDEIIEVHRRSMNGKDIDGFGDDL